MPDRGRGRYSSGCCARKRSATTTGIDYNALLMGIAKELVTARGYIGTVIGHTGLGEARCLELLGLKREDIAYTDWPAKFAQYDDPQWEANKEAMEALAKRLLPVYRELQPLSEAALQTYFLERRVLKLEQQLAAMWPPKQE
jgi:hypothetical protein